MRLLSMSIVCTLCAMLFACVSKQTYVDATQRAAQERETLQEQLRTTEDLLQETENERDDLTGKYANLQTRYRLLETQHRQLAAQLDELSTRTATLQTNLVERDSVLTTQQKIERALRDQIAAQEIKIEGRLKMTLLDTILFATGKAQLNAKGQNTLRQVAASLRDNPEQSVLVEGHTDNVPIGPGAKQRFATNWELSAARATAVVRFLQDRGGVAPERLAGCGYSATGRWPRTTRPRGDGKIGVLNWC